MSDTLGTTLRIESRRGRASPPTGRPQLIVALECSRPTALPARYDLAAVHAVTLGRGRERRALRTGDPGAGAGELGLDLRVPDDWMSSSHARMERAPGHWLLRDTGSKNGVLINGRTVDRAQLHDGDLFELGHTLFLFHEAVDAGDDQPPDLDLSAAGHLDLIIPTLVPALARKLDQLRRVAASLVSVILMGESGTGKEVVARAVHRCSGRSGPFVAVNCGAIPASLVESELFGHRKGAFSGAVEDRPGLVRSAHKGTLFLDEIGDLPPASQAALLRVLQEREVLPVGTASPVPVDVRVISATHRDLDALVAGGSFRQDLFARLAGFRLTLPPLRERRGDLGLLIGALLGKIGAASVALECEAARHMFAYSWPLNIRELEQVLATATVLAQGAPIALEHLPEHLARTAPARPASPVPAMPAPGAEHDQRRHELVEKLREHRGNVSAIARAMGKDRKQIQRWLKRYRLNPAEFRR
jgi:transcriptional regulator with PAS, ATPase and Fis domain